MGNILSQLPALLRAVKWRKGFLSDRSYSRDFHGCPSPIGGQAYAAARKLEAEFAEPGRTQVAGQLRDQSQVAGRTIRGSRETV